MPTQPNDAAKQLEAVLAALQKSLLDASAENLMKELREAGVDPLKAKEVMKFAEGKAIDDHYRKVRESLANERSQTLQKINDAAGFLPGTRAEMLVLLTSVLAQHSEFKSLTAQFRDFKNPEELSDSEISSMLLNFAVLGHLTLSNDNKK